MCKVPFRDEGSSFETHDPSRLLPHKYIPQEPDFLLQALQAPDKPHPWIPLKYPAAAMLSPESPLLSQVPKAPVSR